MVGGDGGWMMGPGGRCPWRWAQVFQQASVSRQLGGSSAASQVAGLARPAGPSLWTPWRRPHVLPCKFQPDPPPHRSP